MICRMIYIREECLVRRTLSDFSLQNMSTCLFLNTQRNMATALTRAYRGGCNFKYSFIQAVSIYPGSKYLWSTYFVSDSVPDAWR